MSIRPLRKQDAISGLLIVAELYACLSIFVVGARLLRGDAPMALPFWMGLELCCLATAVVFLQHQTHTISSVRDAARTTARLSLAPLLGVGMMIAAENGSFGRSISMIAAALGATILASVTLFLIRAPRAAATRTN